MKYKLWSEGYATTGDHQRATYQGEYEGETLMEAYLALVKQIYGDDIPDYVRLNEPVIWGCRIFDNEQDARKSFG